MWKLRGSLFERRSGAAAIDSLVYMKMRALTSLAALKIKDTVVVPSACFRTRSRAAAAVAAAAAAAAAATGNGTARTQPSEAGVERVAPVSQAPRRL